MSDPTDNSIYTVRGVYISKIDDKDKPTTLSIERFGPYDRGTDLGITIVSGVHELAIRVNSRDLLEAIYFLTNKSVHR